METKIVGNRYRFFTYDTQPDARGYYHVGEGGEWGWQMVKSFKSAKSARNWALKRNGGDDSYTN